MRVHISTDVHWGRTLYREGSTVQVPDQVAQTWINTRKAAEVLEDGTLRRIPGRPRTSAGTERAKKRKPAKGRSKRRDVRPEE